MSDCIWIEGLTGRTFVGVEDWEQRDRQEVRIRIRLTADLDAAGRSDLLKDTVNYRSVAKRTLAIVEGERFNLLEHLADTVASMILAEFPRVVAVQLRVEKPGALRFAESVGVEIERHR